MIQQFIEQIRKLIKEEFQKNYASGNPKIPPHTHNGVDNLRINASDIVGLTSGGGTPGGNSTDVQFNNSGDFGGSDAFTFNSSLNSFATYIESATTFSAETFTGSATTVTLANQTSVSGAIAIPFTFKFWENSYSSLYISARGFIGFDNTQMDVQSFAKNIPTVNHPNNAIYAYWVGYDPTTGSIKYETFGSTPNRKFVVGYTNVNEKNGAAHAVTFQIKLLESDSSIEIHTTSALPPGGGEDIVQGLENSDGTLAAGYASRINTTTLSLTNDAVRFERFPGTQSNVLSVPTIDTTTVYASTIKENPTNSPDLDVKSLTGDLILASSTGTTYLGTDATVSPTGNVDIGNTTGNTFVGGQEVQVAAQGFTQIQSYTTDINTQSHRDTFITTEDFTGSDSGSIYIKTGEFSTNNNSGSIRIQTNGMSFAGNNGNSGNIEIQTGKTNGLGTTPGSITLATAVVGFGSASPLNGGNITLSSHSSAGGIISMSVDSSSYGNINIDFSSGGNSGTLRIFGDYDSSLLDLGEKTIYLNDCLDAPVDTPVTGGVLYVASGALKYKGSSGTVTTIAVA